MKEQFLIEAKILHVSQTSSWEYCYPLTVYQAGLHKGLNHKKSGSLDSSDYLAHIDNACILFSSRQH